MLFLPHYMETSNSWNSFYMFSLDGYVLLTKKKCVGFLVVLFNTSAQHHHIMTLQQRTFWKYYSQEQYLLWLKCFSTLFDRNTFILGDFFRFLFIMFERLSTVGEDLTRIQSELFFLPYPSFIFICYVTVIEVFNPFTPTDAFWCIYNKRLWKHYNNRQFFINISIIIIELKTL